MQPISRVIISALVAISFAVAIAGQSGPSKDDLFKQVEKAAKGKKMDEQKTTIQLGRDYLSKFGNDKDDKAKKVTDILTAIKVDWLGQVNKLIQTKKNDDLLKAYEIANTLVTEFRGDTDQLVNGANTFLAKNREAFFNILLSKNRNSDAFLLGEDILDAQPDNLYVKMNMAFIAQELLLKEKDRSFIKDGIDYAREAIKDFDAGKVPSSFDPFKDKDDAHANMYWLIGVFTVENDLATAAGSFHKAVTMPGSLGKRSYGYYIVASYYEARYNNRVKEFQMKYPTGNVPNDVANKEEAARGEIVDRMLDAYARAVKNAQGESNPELPSWKERTQAIYKFRKGSDAGFDNYVNNVMSTPILSFQ